MADEHPRLLKRPVDRVETIVYIRSHPVNGESQLEIVDGMRLDFADGWLHISGPNETSSYPSSSIQAIISRRKPTR